MAKGLSWNKSIGFSRPSTWLIAFLALALISATIIALRPDWNESVRQLIFKKYRILLAKTSGDLTGKGDQVVVIKVKSQDGLFIEIYKPSLNGEPDVPLAYLKLDEKRDGHMNFRGSATNLALTDLDDDSILEIIAPAYDDNLVPRLNVFKYDPASKSFSKFGSDLGTDSPKPQTN